MSSLYNRVVEVTIGKPGEKGLVVKDLRVTFKVTHNTDSTPNHGKISIYNLKKESIDSISGEGVACILKAGYNKDGIDPFINTIFAGEIIKLDSKKVGADIITEITVLERQLKNTTNHISINFKSAVKTEVILRELLKALSYTPGAIDRIIKTAKDKNFKLIKEFPEGISLNGNVKNLIDKVLLREGLYWYTLDGIPYIDSHSIKIKKQEGILLTPSTGLLGIPFPYYKKTISKSKDPVVIEGVKLTCLLQPTLKPGIIIKVQTSTSLQYYKILEVILSGDTHEGEWIAEVTAKNG